MSDKTVLLPPVLCGVLSAVSLLLPWYAPFWAPGLLFGLVVVWPFMRARGRKRWRAALAVIGTAVGFFIASFIQAMAIIVDLHPIALYGLAGIAGGGIVGLSCFGILEKGSFVRILKSCVVGGIGGAVFGLLLATFRTSGFAWLTVMSVGFVFWQVSFAVLVMRDAREANVTASPATMVVAALVVLLCAKSTRAASPKLIATSPKLHAVDVAAGNHRLVFEFDQPMDTTPPGLHGLPETTPKVAGDFAWESPTKMVLPVELEEQRFYVLGGNVKGRHQLNNEQGESAEPFVFAFQTGSSDSNRNEPPLLDEATNRQALDKLRELLDRCYAYRDVHMVEWDAQFAKFEKKMLAAQHADEFALWCTALLAPTDDGHLWVRRSGLRLNVCHHPYTANFNWETLQRVVPEYRTRNALMITGKYSNDINYLAVPTLYMHYHTALKSLGKVWSVVGEQPLVLDVRMNSGGAEPIGMFLAGCLNDRPRTYAQHKSIQSDGTLGPVTERILRPLWFAPCQTGPVAVLIGPKNVSSCESFVMMLKQCPNSKLFGQQTRGSSGNPKTFDLGNGVSVSLPSWQAMDAQGNIIEGVGVSPDETINTTSEDFDDTDPVIDAALDWLSNTH